MIRGPWAYRSRAMRQRSRILQRRADREHRGATERTATIPRAGRRGAVWAKLVGLLALLAISGLLYDSAVSPGFRVHQVHVSGNRLLSTDEVLSAAAVQGLNVFWIRRAEVAERVKHLPAAQEVDVRVALPDRVDIRITERTPYVSWQAGDQTFLVDADGLVLGTQTPEQPLVVIHDLDAPELHAGDTVDAEALAATAALTKSLASALGDTPREYDYSHAHGIEVHAANGTLVRFGTSELIEAKVATLAALRAQLASEGTPPQVIDLRFPSRPYYR